MEFRRGAHEISKGRARGPWIFLSVSTCPSKKVTTVHITCNLNECRKPWCGLPATAYIAGMILRIHLAKKFISSGLIHPFGVVALIVVDVWAFLGPCVVICRHVLVERTRRAHMHSFTHSQPLGREVVASFATKIPRVCLVWNFFVPWPQRWSLKEPPWKKKKKEKEKKKK